MTPLDRTYGPHPYYVFDFPLSRKAWDTFDIGAFVAPGARKGGIQAARLLADSMNRSNAAAQPVSAGQLLAMGLLEDALRYIVDEYCGRHFPASMPEAIEHVRVRAGEVAATKPITAFLRLFPPLTVFREEETESNYLDGVTAGQPNRQILAEELALLALAVENPALKPFHTLFGDAALRRAAPYVEFVACLDAFFATQPPMPLWDGTLFELLRAPMRACPDSIEGQLEFIKLHWGQFLPPELFERLLLTFDIIHEETQMRGLGPGPSQVLEFGPGAYHGPDVYYPEPARFSVDREWMANVVLIAKNVYVWLDQLSKKHARPIARLDQIPDEELMQLALWGFTGLWLIGLWERSPASKKIKQIMGNPEAVASAYSLYDYQIAADLGGEEAYGILRDRAWHWGVRLASDMVPNHVGIYSKWVVEHPQWFLQAETPPFPSYRFTGPDLSEDSRVGLQIEDGYWEHRDAAVVFKRVDRWSGETRYIYHGNDGTSMPWNDTAQLNFLLPEVREAVIQTIVHVARKFPIIRFDAAMTLAKRHYQRLWFPQKGDAGAIPSRAEHSMTRPEFDEVFPEEFWRQVVDRVQAEAPDTLLLAEAFWLMEGYFVRTLGMHRVYNSAFMNMLKMEENSKYRQTIKNVLEFSPAVLQRFVNFMNNPDEATAVEQFGRDEKYYGVAVMLATMPGLPMFGHGQVEGLTEKYGMEYRKAYWDEPVDLHMVWRHETEVFPLMRKRRMFSGAENFALFDFTVPEGWVDENVYAYTNRFRDDRALILYNNAYTTTMGHVHTSTAINQGDAEHKHLARKTLSEALGLETGKRQYYTFRDLRTGLEYLHNAHKLAEKGLHLQLHAYQYHAFLDFRLHHDDDGSWERLDHHLAGHGVSSVVEAYHELRYASVMTPLRALLNPTMLRTLAETSTKLPQEELASALVMFLDTAAEAAHVTVNTKSAFDAISSDLKELHRLPEWIEKAKLDPDIESFLCGPMPAEDDTALGFYRVPIAWSITRRVADALPVIDAAAEAAAGVPEPILRKVVAEAFRGLGADENGAALDAALVTLLRGYGPLLSAPTAIVRDTLLRRLFDDSVGQRYLGVNRHQGILYFRKETLESLLYWLFFTAAWTVLAEARPDADAMPGRFENLQSILAAAADGGYQVERTLALLNR